MACGGHNATVGCHTHDGVVSCGDHDGVSGCNVHDGEVSCDGHDALSNGGQPCPTNLTSFTDPTLTTDTKIKNEHINELREAIDTERVRRGFGQYWNGADVGVGVKIEDTDASSLRAALAEVKSGLTWTNINSIVENVTPVDETHIDEARANINIAEAECLCYCNYACTCNCNYACTCNCNYACTCNCNYACTCNCNYACTCNCNYCTCNCNYNCTCNCNYSDKNLKKEISYI